MLHSNRFSKIVRHSVAPTAQKLNMMKYFHLFFIPTCKGAHAHDMRVVQLKQNTQKNEQLGSWCLDGMN